MIKQTPIDNDAVRVAYDAYPAAARQRLLEIRGLIFDAAANRESVGTLTETLKWGEPAYLTNESKSGSTIRLGWKPATADQVGIYLNCQTTLIDTCRSLFPELTSEGNRAILFPVAAPLPRETVLHCVGLALTYHRDKRRKQAAPA